MGVPAAVIRLGDFKTDVGLNDPGDGPELIAKAALRVVGIALGALDLIERLEAFNCVSAGLGDDVAGHVGGKAVRAFLDRGQCVKAGALGVAAAVADVHVHQVLLRVEVGKQVHLFGAIVAGQNRIIAAQGAGHQVLGRQAAKRRIVRLLGGFQVSIEPACRQRGRAGAGTLHVVLALKWLRVPLGEPTLRIGIAVPLSIMSSKGFILALMPQ